LVLGLILGTAPCAVAQTWISPVTANWSSPTSWTGGVPTSTPTTNLVFTNSGLPATIYNATNDVANPFSFNQVTLDTKFGSLGSSYANPRLNIDGSALQSAGTNPIIRQSGAGASINNDLVLSALTRLEANSPAHLAINGVISGGAGLDVSATSAGKGFLLLRGANTYSGGTTLNSGNLGLGANTALGTGTVIIAGGTLRMADFVSPNGVVLANNLTLNSDLVFTGNNSGNLTGVLSGIGGVVNRPNTGISLRLAGINTYAGPTTVALVTGGGSSSAQINLEGANGSALNSSAFNIAGLFGTLQLNNQTTVSSGVAGGNNNNRIADTAPINLGSRGTFALLSNDATIPVATDETVGALNATGSPFVTINQSVTATNRSGTLRFSSLNTNPAAAVLYRGVNLGGNAPGTAGNDNILFATVPTLVGGGGTVGTTNISIVPAAFGHFNNGVTSTTWFGGGNSFVTSTANGLRPLNTVTEYVATITPGSTVTDNARLITLQNNINSPTEINALVLDRTSASDYGRVSGSSTLKVTSGMILAAGASGNSDPNNANRNRIEVAVLDFGSVQGNIIAPEVLTISSVITGSAGLHKGSGNTVTLQGVNTFTGPVSVTGGLLAVTSLANLGGTGSVSVDGGSLQYLGSSSESFTRGFITGNAAGGLNVSQATGMVNLQGSIAGTGNFIKSGSGTLVMQTANTFTGDLVLSAGTVEVSATNQLGNGSQISLLPGATLRVAGNVTTGKSLLLNAGGGTRAVEVTSGNKLTLNGSIDHNGSTSNSLPLTKTGAGTLEINNSHNGFDGQLQVNAGAVLVNGVIGPVSTASPFGVTVAAGATLGGAGIIDRDVQFSPAAVLAPGTSPGTLTVEGPTTFAGGFVYNWELGDLLDVNNDVNFSGGMATLNLTNFGNAFAGPYVLIDAANFNGTLPTWSLDYTNAANWAGLDLAVVAVGNQLQLTAVPEPGTWALMLLTIPAAWLIRRRRLVSAS
jgi:autotransporter-associated beta strand protein